ncbi:hypothetical protein TEA_001128 [Camellia sinensis var. sinensis]|uniref:Uncharacterized protein n=1 Tax=Camellia sinensis var. sinensis TaxID=542762 RepID=A0A4V3WK73_CAMSN|nr:hypothetical protein TEA_001128 [Camellia sinensis var. sinensis]
MLLMHVHKMTLSSPKKVDSNFTESGSNSCLGGDLIKGRVVALEAIGKSTSTTSTAWAKLKLAWANPEITQTGNCCEPETSAGTTAQRWPWAPGEKILDFLSFFLWLLGYPVVYLFGKEHIADAIYNLSTKSLHLFKVLVHRNGTSSKGNQEEELMR